MQRALFCLTWVLLLAGCEPKGTPSQLTRSCDRGDAQSCVNLGLLFEFR